MSANTANVVLTGCLAPDVPLTGCLAPIDKAGLEGLIASGKANPQAVNALLKAKLGIE